MLPLTARAVTGVPFEKRMPGRSLNVQVTRSAATVHDWARSGSMVESGPTRTSVLKMCLRMLWAGMSMTKPPSSVVMSLPPAYTSVRGASAAQTGAGTAA